MRHLLLGVCVSLLSTVCETTAVFNVEQERLQIPSFTPSSSLPFDVDFDAFVEQTLHNWHVPGLSIAIVENGRVASKGYGFATLPDQKATADTRYFTASTTKAFTAAAIGMLVHDTSYNYSTVRWASPINDFIRADFVLENDYATNYITVEDALSHRTGLPGHDLFYGQEGDTPSRVVQRLRWLAMNAQPRTEWQYCNVMYAVITHVLQTVTGEALDTLLQKWIWEPLGMRSTSFTIPQSGEESTRVATGYYWVSNESDKENRMSRDGYYIRERLMDLACTSGDGAMLSTVNDYALWIKALLEAADPGISRNQSSPISRALFQDLVTPRAVISVESEPEEPLQVPPLYALGWITAKVADQQVITHSGGIDGFSTEVWMLPGLQYGIVTMSNTANEADIEIVTRLIAEKLHLGNSGMKGVSTVRKDLRILQRASLQTRRHRRQRVSSGAATVQMPPAPLPLPLPLEDFAGLYSHPAYGSINLTIAPSTDAPRLPGKDSDTLSGIFYPRANVEKQILRHISGTLFQLQSLQAHGVGDILTGDGVVWEDVGDEALQTFAVFETSPSGGKVERLGLDLDPDLVRTARKTVGPSRWRMGMIWFDRA